MPETEDLYEILQLHPSAHQEVIDAAYQRLALLYHPATDPSPEAAEKLGAIGKAYAVLGDPEKRSAYDQSKEAEQKALRSQEEEVPTETEPPKPRPRRKTRQSDLDYITIGSTKEDVSRIQGPPNDTGSNSVSGREGEWWVYGSNCSVRFNKAGRVQGWSNRGTLKVMIIPGPNTTTSEFFSVGSHKDDVVRLQGTPSNVWVTNPRTSAAMQKEREFRKLMRDVDSDLGKPRNPEYDKPVGKFDDDDYSDLETWHFAGYIVEFSIGTGRVTAWDNKNGSLKVTGTSPQTETAKAQSRAAVSATPATTRPSAPSTAQGCGGLLAALALLAVGAVMASFLV